MRRLTNLQEFYADTSTLRVPKEVSIKGFVDEDDIEDVKKFIKDKMTKE